MKAATLAAVTALTLAVREALNEINVRCAETTWLKLTGACTDAETAVAAEGEPDPMPAPISAEQYEDLAGRVVAAVHEGLSQAVETVAPAA